MEICCNNKFETFLHKVGPIFSLNICGWAFIRGSIIGVICLKNHIFGVQTGGWAFIRAWASNNIFTVHVYSCIIEFIKRVWGGGGLERSGAVEECLTRDREAAGSSLTVVLEQDTFILA